MRKWHFVPVATIGLLVGAGCLQPPAPTSRREPQPAAPEREPILVESAATSTAAEPEPTVDDLVRAYTARVNAASTSGAEGVRHASPLAADADLQEVEVVDSQAQSPRTLDVTPAAVPEAVLATTQPAAAAAPAEAAAPDQELPESAAPPVLVNVALHGKPTVNPPAVRPSAERRELATQAGFAVADLPTLFPAPDDADFAAQLDRRLACLLAGDYAAALQPLPVASAAQQEAAARLVEAVIELREAHLGDPDAVKAALPPIERLAETLRGAGDLHLVTRLCSSVQGFGQYVEARPDAFVTGQPVEFVLYCEVAGFTSQEEADGAWISRFDLRTEVLTPAGDALTTLDDHDIVDRCRSRRRDCFIPRLVRLPATLSPGPYVVRVTLTDRLGDKVTEQRVAFRVAAE